MPIRCPNCNEYLDPDKGSCGTEACLSPLYGVARMMRQEFFQAFDLYSRQFEQIREKEGLRIKDPSLYENMPFVKTKKSADRYQWHLRCYDLAILKKVMRSGSGQKVLDFGSWNGWLSNTLVNWGHVPTAVGYFIDPYDGLGAKQFYRNDWLSVQMDLEDLSILT